MSGKLGSRLRRSGLRTGVLAPLCAAGLAMGGCATSSPAPVERWVNPLVQQRADPQVFLHSDGFYYMMATYPGYDRLELRRSQSIAGLGSGEVRSITVPVAGSGAAKPFWAPELHRIDGAWYIYYTAGAPGQDYGSIRPHALRNDAADPFTGEWRDAGRILTKWDTFSLDATTFEHRGQRFFVWTQVEPGVQGTNIMIARMRSPTELEARQTVIARPIHEWERRGYWVNEAPAVLVRNGRVFIAFSASATDANYAVGLLSAPADADLLDPAVWTKNPQPVLKSSAANSQYGPGHNSFTTTPDGKTDMLVYHSRNYEKIAGDALQNDDRATRAQVVRWKADGAPDFGEPVADGPYVVPTP